jgi:hypothetical protein
MVYVWVKPDAEWFARIRDGWEQFARDLAAYVLPEAAAPAPVGKAPDLLPALRIEVTGAVTASNLAEFKATALGAIRSVNRTLKTDQDFADADKAVKWCGDVEARLKAAKEHALSQTADIEALFRALDEIGAEAKTVRLDLDKLVTRRKTEVKEEAVAKARRAFDEHVASLNAELAPMRLQPVPADFAGAIKGLRSIASMQDALDTTLAGAKIAADAQARGIRHNVANFKGTTGGNSALHALFPDLHQLVHKAADDFSAVIDARIAKHRADEAAREQERQADEAARIAAAEKRAREQEAARIAAQQAEDARVAALAKQREQDAAAESVRVASAALAQASETTTAPAPAPMAAATVQAVSAPASVTTTLSDDEPATLKLGTICERLGITMTAEFVGEILNVKPAKVAGSACLYTEAQYQRICNALISHTRGAAVLYAGETA